jgi:hypothetical protein
MAPGTKSGWEWQPVDISKIDWAAQFKALTRDGHSHAVSLETHWHGGGTSEASTCGGMKGLMACMEKLVCGKCEQYSDYYLLGV